ncbi:disintegrin and metalloproteinase domain-containing protein 8 isoform X2 [Choloepus didactylus]|uniref:disintegrin and metalloproteinase domain-containing protein 8 isoform X2 n=1 Tax=Choloepus didactylus TaxID=27675 RepID=UPI00189D047E|nr:disintegrin and metalloproteinase domain-containing protein 8 isoform X2 [Choloepus didactylus]
MEKVEGRGRPRGVATQAAPLCLAPPPRLSVGPIGCGPGPGRERRVKAAGWAGPGPEVSRAESRPAGRLLPPPVPPRARPSRPRLPQAMHALVFWLPSALWLQVMAFRPPLAHVERYEVVQPRRLPGPRPRRALPSGSALYPESVSYQLEVQGSSFTLHLRKNRDLLGLRYTETYTAANGSEVTERLQEQDHCLYQGHVEGHQLSAASVSTCDGLRGFLQVGSAVHLIEPLDGGGEEGQHALYQAEHLRQKAGTCGVSHTSLEAVLGPRIAAAFRPQPRSQPLSRETRYVELYVVTDRTEFWRAGGRDAVRRRVLEVVNHVDKLYQALNFRVVLVGLEMWNDRDKFVISETAEVTLDGFLDWRATNLVGRHQHDNVQLITGVDFAGSTVGLAKVATMCGRGSGAVNQDHSESPVGVASTLAHEMGHNLGLDHDDNIPGCYCAVPGSQGGCVMASSLSIVFPKAFSRCSVGDLEMFVEKPQAGCLENAPDPTRLVSDPVCGNGFLERGEQCDCGSPQACRDPCCNATSCRLAKGAECAHGACCHGCQVRPAGALCRPAKDSCDLEEYCDGRGPVCPEDVFQENGWPCPEGYCYDGRCPTLAQRCQELWGPGTRGAAEICSTYSLSLGCTISSQTLGAGPRTNKCGVLYCEGGQKPLERRSCSFSLPQAHCSALLTETSTAYEAVPDGTRCGEQKVCWRGHCENLHVYRSQNCSAKCSGHGVCNHKSQCHCRQGWAPPHCAELLGNVQAASGSMPVGGLVAVVLLVTILLVLAAALILRRARSCDQKRNVAPKTHVGRSNPLFHDGDSRVPEPTVGPPNLVSATSPSGPPRSTASSVTPKRPPPAPPASMSSPPFPVPVYTQQTPKRFRPAPPTKPLPELKPKQVVRPAFAPPVPPGKPGAGGSAAAPSQVVGPKVALKPPV